MNRFKDLKRYTKIKIGDLAEVITGGTPSTRKNEYWDNGTIPWLPSGECQDKEINSASKFITEEGMKNSAAKLMPKSTVVIALTGATTGKTGILNIEATANQSVTGIVPNNKFIPKYIFYYLRSIRQKILHDSYGGAQKHISQGYVKDIEVLLPSLEMQKKIVNVLELTEKTLEKRKEAIRLLDELVKSQFIEMFGNPYKNEKGWEIAEIGKYLNILTDYHSNGSYETLRDNVTLLDTPSYALMVRTTDLENNNFENEVKYIDEHAYNHLEKSKVFGGEIIINKIGSAGKVYLMPYLNRPVSLAMNQFLLRFDEEKVNHIFLYNLLLTPYMESKIKEKVRGAVTKTITKDAIREINIIVPPISLQKEFVEFVKQVDKLKFKMEESLKELENNFNSLMQKAFTGELF